MIKKPSMRYASIIKVDDKLNLSANTIKHLSPSALNALKSGMGYRSMTGEDLLVGEKISLKGLNYGDWLHFTVEGARTEISLYRLVGGCNNLSFFENENCEKSEDYDNIPTSHILDLPRDYDDAIKVINDKYLGRTLRVVARSAENSDQYGRRFFLFAID